MDSAYAKLNRAKGHRDQLVREMKAFEVNDPFDWIFDEVASPDPRFARLAVTIHNKTPTPSSWGLIVGDILTNLRAALDHALFGHASSRKKLTEDEERRLQYPIVTSRENWFGAPAVPATATTARKKKIDSKRDQLAPWVDADVLDAIERTQPFSVPKVPDPSLESLAVLDSLVNRDKHREIRVVSHVSKGLNIEHSTFKVLKNEPLEVVMVEGATVAHITVERTLRMPWEASMWTGGMFHVVNGYNPCIRVPATADYIPVRWGMNNLVARVDEALKFLKKAGC
jgi:hypothetical protein